MDMMNLKSGDKVRICKDLFKLEDMWLKGGSNRETVSIVREMTEYEGKEVTIREQVRIDDVSYGATYSLKEFPFTWQHYMFEPIKEENEI